VVVVPEIADFEVRRELLRMGRGESVSTLDRLCAAARYEAITTPIMRRAAALWAEVRRAGRPTASEKALDADVILAAMALELADAGHDVEVATTNVGHLARFVRAALWNEFSP
jgi:hypothetical protein